MVFSYKQIMSSKWPKLYTLFNKWFDDTGFSIAFFVFLCLMTVVVFCFFKFVSSRFFVFKGYDNKQAQKHAVIPGVIHTILYFCFGIFYSTLFWVFWVFILFLILPGKNKLYKYGISDADKLLKWKELLDAGAITEEEYNRKKDEILNK